VEIDNSSCLQLCSYNGGQRRSDDGVSLELWNERHDDEHISGVSQLQKGSDDLNHSDSAVPFLTAGEVPLYLDLPRPPLDLDQGASELTGKSEMP
jgi:hypothetical protein